MDIEVNRMLIKYKKGKLSIQDIKDDPVGVFLMLPFINLRTVFQEEEILEAITSVSPDTIAKVVSEYGKGPNSFIEWLHSTGSNDVHTCTIIALVFSVGCANLSIHSKEILKGLKE